MIPSLPSARVVPSAYRLTISGRDALEELDRLADDEARQSAQKAAEQNAAQQWEAKKERANWARFWLGLLIGWLLGAFTPLDLWAALSRFFQSLIAHVR